VIVGLVVAGLGTKVGLVPLHVALPVAYAAAPFAATAALASGMLTAALTGLVRFLPLGTASMPDGGFWIAVAGAAGALWGVGVALVQTDVRALVAYSTVTTGGLLCMAIGTGLRDAAAWEAAVGAVVVYAFHNATAKVALLVGLGVAATVGRRARGLVLAGLLLPALALVGVPGTGGAAAKAGLHEALVLLPAPWSGWADLVSGVVAVGTVLVVARGLLLADAAIPEATVPRPLGRVLPWLAALVALAATPALLTLVAPSLVMTSLQADAALAAVKKLAIGLALAGAAVWLRGRPDPTRPAAVPPGDVLGLVAPPVRAAGRALVALAALPDRLTPPALPSPSGRDPEAALRDPAIVGVVVLALAGAVALLLALR
jgi:formate hydrogenlyase subunit 3/multisubunit Na+/H+ antiporter MnhD subunit